MKCNNTKLEKIQNRTSELHSILIDIKSNWNLIPITEQTKLRRSILSDINSLLNKINK